MRLNFRFVISVFFLLVLSCGSVFGFTVQKLLEWPTLSDDVVAVDSQNNYVFHAFGNQIKIFSSTDLSYTTSYNLDSVYEITSLYADQDKKNLYVGAGDSGFYILDYTDINSITKLSSVADVSQDPGYLQGVKRSYINVSGFVLNGSYLYIADNGYGLRIFNVSDAANPQYEGGYRQDGSSEDLTTGGYFDLDFFSFNSKNYVAVLDLYYGLRIFDVTDPSKYLNPMPDTKDRETADPDPVAKKDLRTAFYNSVTLARDIKARNIDSKWYLFVADRSATEEKAAVAKLKVFDDNGDILSSPSNIGRSDELLKGNSIAVDDTYSYTADGTNGLSVVDMKNSTGTTSGGVEIYKSVATLASAGFKYAYSLYLSGTDIFIADFIKGIAKVDISSPSSPVLKSSTGEFFSVLSLALNGDTLGVVQSDSRNPSFSFFNVENRSLSKFIGRVDAKALFIEKYNTSMAGAASDKLYIFKNISSSPSVEYQTDLALTPTGMAVYGDYIFLGYDGGVDVYTVQSGVLTKVKTFFAGKSVTSMHVDSASKRIFIGTKASGVSFFNLSDPSSPLESGNYSMTDQAQAVSYYSSKLYIGKGSDVVVVDITDENSPSLFTTINVKSSVNSISMDENFLFAGCENGINIYSSAELTSPVFLSTHSTKGDVVDIRTDGKYIYSADSKGGFSMSEYDKTAGSDPTPMESSSSSSVCFLGTIF